jgi:hypothetical protein
MNPSTLPRNKRPVFVLGSPRSGTTLLYHMLLSAGNFAVYRTESDVFNLLLPRFGDLSVRRNREALMKVWLRSKLFERSGLNAAEIERKVVAECTNGGDFLRIVMGEMCRKQGVERWADCTPEHLLYLDQIKRTIPEALVIHIVRDGRDVALSLDKQGWIRPFPWDKSNSVLVAGLYWEWIVNKGRENGRAWGGDYTEVHFEDLISDPRPTLKKLGEFVEHDLDYDRILSVGIGSVSDPNTSFKSGEKRTFNPVGRWRSQFTAEALAEFETFLGSTLKDLGYALASGKDPRNGRQFSGRRAAYQTVYGTKLWLKRNTPLGRWLISDDLSWL